MHPEIGQLAGGGSVPEMFFLAAEENVFPGSNLAGMTVCGDGQRGGVLTAGEHFIFVFVCFAVDDVKLHGKAQHGARIGNRNNGIKIHIGDFSVGIGELFKSHRIAEHLAGIRNT